MPITTHNPDTLPKPELYRQVAVASGSRLVFIAGQVARDAQGNPVGAGDLAAQAAQAMVNVAEAMTAVGGTFDDIARLNIYVVDWSPEKMADLAAGTMQAAAQVGIDLARPITLIGVAALGEPDLLIEIEATAVLP
jgi:enamine deaminase RidA (YjgF/YER057c/UK114 family)